MRRCSLLRLPGMRTRVSRRGVGAILMNEAVSDFMARMEARFGPSRQVGRSRVFCFGEKFICSINFSKELRGKKFFFGLAEEICDPKTKLPTVPCGHFVVLVCGAADNCLILPRTLALEALAGVPTRKLDVFPDEGRYILQTTGHPKRDVTQFLNALPQSEPPEATAPNPPPAETREHSTIQAALIRMGRAEGLDVWVPPADRGQRHQSLKFADHTLPRLPNLGIDEVSRRIVTNIDVLWLRRNAVLRAFEIESTTSIYSGLLRLNDLIVSQPNARIELCIAAAERRRENVRRQLSRPTFQDLVRRCGFLTFEAITAACTRLDALGDGDGLRVAGLLRYEELTPLGYTDEVFR